MRCVLAAVGGDAELAQRAGHLAAVDVAGELDRGHDRRALVRVAVQVEPEPGDAGARGAGEQVVAGPDVLQALLLDHAQRDVEAEEQRHGRRERARALRLALRGLAPVEVVAAAGLAFAASSARSLTEAKARPGGVMSAFCEPATTTSTPHASCSSRAAPRPETASTTSSAPWRLTTSAIAWMSCTMPGRGLAQRGEDDLDARVLPQQAVDVGRIEAHAPARLVADEVGPVGLAELDPALAELARGQRERLGPRAHEVGDGGLHGARAARGEGEHGVARPEDHRQARRARARRARRRPAPGGRASASPSPGTPPAARASGRRS